MESLSIGQVAHRAGVGVETVRFYERRGLIEEPPRRPSGYRQFPPETVAVIRFIRRCKRLGFSLDEIAELSALRFDPGALAADVRARAEAKVADIEARIASLERMRATLVELTERCNGEGTSRDCRILAVLADEAETTL